MTIDVAMTQRYVMLSLCFERFNHWSWHKAIDVICDGIVLLGKLTTFDVTHNNRIDTFLHGNQFRTIHIVLNRCDMLTLYSIGTETN